MTNLLFIFGWQKLSSCGRSVSDKRILRITINETKTWKIEALSLNVDQMERISRILFPMNPIQVDINRFKGLLTLHYEIAGRGSPLKNKQAAGFDDIPIQKHCLVFVHRPDPTAFNVWPKKGMFPCRWKVARLALISKLHENAELTSAYRRSRVRSCDPMSANEKCWHPYLQQ